MIYPQICSGRSNLNVKLWHLLSPNSLSPLTLQNVDQKLNLLFNIYINL